MNLLLHTCCAPCSIMCIQTLREDGVEPTLFWYNPNIHPYTEYRNRQDTLKGYANDIGVDLILSGEYGLRSFVKQVADAPDKRCGYCYDCRLSATAAYAAENGYDAFSTTLLISPYQDHEKIIFAAEDAAVRYGVDFYYRDFRPYFRQGQQMAREMGLYMQKYCGCIFSEEERYLKRA